MTPTELVDEMAVLIIRELARPLAVSEVDIRDVKNRFQLEALREACERRLHADTERELRANIPPPKRGTHPSICPACGRWWWWRGGKRRRKSTTALVGQVNDRTN